MLYLVKTYEKLGTIINIFSMLQNDRVTCKQSLGRILPQHSCLPSLLIVLIPPSKTPVPE